MLKLTAGLKDATQHSTALRGQLRERDQVAAESGAELAACRAMADALSCGLSSYASTGMRLESARRSSSADPVFMAQCSVLSLR